MATLIPASGVRIIDTLMTNYKTGTITTDLTSPSWEWTITALDNAPSNVIDRNISVIVGSGIVINYFDKVGLYPIEELGYVTPSLEVVSINALGELPEDPRLSPRIFKYIVDGKNYMEWRVDVTVTGTEITETEGGGGNGGGGTTSREVTLSGSYIVYVEVDYDEHKNILRGLLDERSRF